MNNPTEELIRQLDSIRRIENEQLKIYHEVVAQRDMLIQAIKLYKNHQEGTKGHYCSICNGYLINALAKVEDKNDKA
jgi:hypothetical protein